MKNWEKATLSVLGGSKKAPAKNRKSSTKAKVKTSLTTDKAADTLIAALTEG